MSCSTNDIRHIPVQKQWACPAPLMASVTLLFWNSEHVLLHYWHPSHYCSETVSMSCSTNDIRQINDIRHITSETVSMSCSTNGIRHITILKQWACPALAHNSCSETVSMSCSTNGIRHITVLKQWACPAPLMTSVTLLFRNSEHVLLD